MALCFQTLPDLLAHGFDSLIDVRSPAEYDEDHVPGAISLPALSNDQRAVVGTIYKQENPFKARKIGAAMVARNVASHLDGPLAGKDGAWRPLVYCWRGGQRSGSFSSILAQIGWRTDTIDGGYKSYRRLVVEMLHDRALNHRIVLLDGNTGTAKTSILTKLGARGVQVLDLEGLGRHRGSLFGSVAGGQPAQKWFETRLMQGLLAASPERWLVIEAESAKVGDLGVPPSLWAAMCAAPRVVIEAPLEARADYLTRTYADITADPARLEATLLKLKAFVPGEVLNDWLALAETRQFRDLAASLMAHHYDPRYRRQRDRHESQVLGTLRSERLDEPGLDALAAEVEGVLARYGSGT